MRAGQTQTKRSSIVIEDEPSPLEDIPEEEVEFVDTFLSALVMPSESATKVNQIDIKLALKALPIHVDENNVFRCEVLNMVEIKSALISYHNNSQD